MNFEFSSGNHPDQDEIVLMADALLTPVRTSIPDDPEDRGQESQAREVFLNLFVAEALARVDTPELRDTLTPRDKQVMAREAAIVVFAAEEAVRRGLATIQVFREHRQP